MWVHLQYRTTMHVTHMRKLFWPGIDFHPEGNFPFLNEGTEEKETLSLQSSLNRAKNSFPYIATSRATYELEIVPLWRATTTTTIPCIRLTETEKSQAASKYNYRILKINTFHILLVYIWFTHASWMRRRTCLS